MLRRLFFGLVLGLLVGVFAAAAVVKGLHLETFGNPIVAYGLAVATGLLTGLVAGKPIWSADGKIEAGLKAFFGALLAAGGMFALRQWLKLDLDLTALQAGQGAASDLPAFALPAIAGVLGGFFELDNDAPAEKPGQRVSAGTRVTGKAKAAPAEALEDDELEPAPAAKKKR